MYWVTVLIMFLYYNILPILFAFMCCPRSRYSLGFEKGQQEERPVLEFLNNLWGQEPGKKRVVVPARQTTQAGRNDSLELIPELIIRLKIRARKQVLDPSMEYCRSFYCKCRIRLGVHVMKCKAFIQLRGEWTIKNAILAQL